MVDTYCASFFGISKAWFLAKQPRIRKEQRLLRIEQLKSQNPLSLQQINLLATNENINDMPVLIEGIFDNKSVFLLDNQVNKGRLGYRAYQVLITKKYAVLVNLGWVPGSIDRKKLPQIKALSGKHSIYGNVRLIEIGIQLQEQVFNDIKWPLRIQQVELGKLSTLINRQLLPFVIYIDKNEKIGFEKNWQPIVMPPEKHRAYAFQWFCLATAWLMLMTWAKFNTRKASERNQNNNSPLKKEA